VYVSKDMQLIAKLFLLDFESYVVIASCKFVYTVLLFVIKSRGRPNFVFVFGPKNDDFFRFSAFYFSAENR